MDGNEVYEVCDGNEVCDGSEVFLLADLICFSLETQWKFEIPLLFLILMFFKSFNEDNIVKS